MHYPFVFAIAALSVLAVPNADCTVQDPDGAGVSISKTVKPEDVGLPLYPGARPYKEDSDSSSSVQFGAWGGGGEGFKLAVIKLESPASPDKIKDFYRNALGKYGPVLDCKDADARSGKRGSRNELTCESDKPDAGGTLLKAGSNDNQHNVSIKREGNRTIVALVYVRGNKH